MLDVPHVSELARFPWSECAPFRGASCLRIALNGGTNDATVTEGDLDIADTVERFFRFYLYVGSNFDATADDTMNLFELQQAGGTIEAALGLRLTAATDLIEIGVGDGVAPTDFSAQGLARNRWYAIEWSVLVSVTPGTLGTQTLYVDGVSRVALTTLTHAAAIGQGVLGAQNHLATTTGTMLLDQFVMDDLRVYPIVDRFPEHLLLTQSGHAFVGTGCIENISLLSGVGTDNVLTVYDTNRANTNDASKIVVELKNTVNSELIDPAGMPARVHRGCYVALSGTNPRALVKLGGAPAYSAAGLRNWGQRQGNAELEIL